EPSTLVLAGIAGTIFVAFGVVKWRAKPIGAVGWWPCSVAIGLVLTGAPSTRAGSIRLTTEVVARVGSGIQADPASPRVAALDPAARSFQRGDWETCLQQLGQAIPTLPPAQALFAKLAFQNNQPALIHPALERAIAENPEHPEVFILFGNLAVLEGRLTDA